MEISGSLACSGMQPGTHTRLNTITELGSHLSMTVMHKRATRASLAGTQALGSGSHCQHPRRSPLRHDRKAWEQMRQAWIVTNLIPCGTL